MVSNCSGGMFSGPSKASRAQDAPLSGATYLQWCRDLPATRRHRPPRTAPAAKKVLTPCLQARQRREESRAAGGGLLEGASAALRILLRSPLFKKLTLCMMLYGMVSEGMQVRLGGRCQGK